MINHNSIFGKRKYSGKKGVFFQVIILVGFQFILFTAIILSMSKDSSTGSVTDISTAMLSLDRKLDYKTSSSQVFLNSEVNDYVRSIFISGELQGDTTEKQLCVKYNGLQVINGVCTFDTDTFKRNIARRISDACYAYFKQDCTNSFDPQTAIIQISSKEKKTGYNHSLLSGTYDAKTSISKKINEYANLIRAKAISDSLNTCSDISCVAEKVKTMSDVEVIYSDPDENRKILSDVVSELDSCQRHIDKDCNCFTYDLTRIPEGSEIVISDHEPGYSADFIFDGNALHRNFFRKNYAFALSDRKKYNFSGMKIKRDGIYSKDGRRLSPYLYVSGSDVVDELVFSRDSSKRSCDDNFFISSTDDISYKILSSLSLSNSVVASANQAVHISVIEDTSLSEGVLARISIVSDDVNLRSSVIGSNILESLRFKINGDKTLAGKVLFDPISRVPRYSVYDQIPGMVVGNSGITIIQIRVKNKRSYDEGISDYSLFKDTFIGAMKKSIQSSIDVPYYSNTRTVMLRLKGESVIAEDKTSGFFFAATLEDKTPPDNARSIELEYPEISEDIAFIKFLPSVSTDISGYNVYFSRSQSLPTRPSFKVSLKSMSDADKQINSFISGNFFARFVTKQVGLSGTYRALVGSYFDVRGSFVENTDMPEKYKIYSQIRDRGAMEDDSIKEMRISIKPSKDDLYVFLTAYDISGNENKAVEPIRLDMSNIKKIPSAALCNLESFSLNSKTIVCETPTRTIFGEEWNAERHGQLVKKTYYQCLDDSTKDLIFDMVTEGFPTETEYATCIASGKKLYFLISFDTARKSGALYVRKAKELYADSWKTFLIESGFVPYVINSKTVSADGSTSLTYYLEKAE